MISLRGKQKIHYCPLLKDSETLIKKTHTKSKVSIEFILTKPRETFSLKPFLLSVLTPKGR